MVDRAIACWNLDVMNMIIRLNRGSVPIGDRAIRANEDEYDRLSRLGVQRIHRFAREIDSGCWRTRAGGRNAEAANHRKDSHEAQAKDQLQNCGSSLLMAVHGSLYPSRNQILNRTRVKVHCRRAAATISFVEVVRSLRRHIPKRYFIISATDKASVATG